MIPYTLIVTSASRPHCLGPTLRSLARFLDQAPTAVVVHDDAAGAPGVWGATKATLQEVVPHWWPTARLMALHSDPPRRLGPAVAWLLDQVQTEYVLYTQDDFVTVRALPIPQALDVMHYNTLHHIRFNKRATLAVKDTWQGPWQKVEQEFSADPEMSRRFWPPTYRKESLPPWHCGSAGCDGHGLRVVLTVADHWYFQTSLWRVTEMRQAFHFLRATAARRMLLATEEVEQLVNHYFDTERYGGDATDPRVRTACQRTYIWGPIGEDRYVRHIGGAVADWRGGHARVGGPDDPETAWREIAAYPGTEGLRA